MFRMRFESRSGSGDGGDVSESVYCRDVSCSTGGPAVFEGRVGRMGEVWRVRSTSRSPSCNSTGVTGWGVAHDERAGRSPISDVDAQQLRELVRPFVELQSAAYVLAADTERDSDSSSPGSESTRSTSSYGNISGYSSSASEEDKAEMNALQRRRKPWEDPLVALANCVDDATCPSRRPSFKRNKLRKVFCKIFGVTAVRRFLKNPFIVFNVRRGQEIYSAGAPEGVNSVILPRRTKSAFYPAMVDVELAQMRPAHRRAKSLIQFETVHSTQRDVEPWSMEEYMSRNGRLYKWNTRTNDEEFGTIEGNNLMNQCFDATPTYYDSDSN